LFVSADDLEKNPEHENEPRWQPNPAKIIKVTPQKADFRLRKCQGVNVIKPAIPPLAPIQGMVEAGADAMCKRSPTKAASAINAI
jgi:hypothetical protein